MFCEFGALRWCVVRVSCGAPIALFCIMPIRITQIGITQACATNSTPSERKKGAGRQSREIYRALPTPFHPCTRNHPVGRFSFPTYGSRLRSVGQTFRHQRALSRVLGQVDSLNLGAIGFGSAAQLAEQRCPGCMEQVVVAQRRG